jgi:anti-anti-sigma factor
VVFGEPARALLELIERERAEMVVVGGPRHSGSTSNPLGSAFLAIAGTAASPVVVVPAKLAATSATTAPIVCGVDGSPPSLAGARLAAQLADRLDAPLRMVHEAHAGPRVRDTYRSPAQRLADLAQRQRAQLLVTSTRGERAHRGRLLGSVASALTRTSRTPVMMVRPDAHAADGPRELSRAIRRLRTCCGILRVTGEIDVASVTKLELEATQLLGSAAGRLVLDLSQTTFIDLAGLRMTQRLARRAAEAEGDLVLVRGTPGLERLLGLVPHPWMAVETDLAAALARIGDDERQNR